MTNRKWKIIGVYLLIGFCIWLIIYGVFLSNELLKNQRLISAGYPYECLYGGKGNAGRLFVGYTFQLDGKEIKGHSMYGTDELSVDDCQKHFVGKTFPIVYDFKMPTNNIILITPKVFKKYGYSFPDSLQWALKYIRQ